MEVANEHVYEEESEYLEEVEEEYYEEEEEVEYEEEVEEVLEEVVEDDYSVEDIEESFVEEVEVTDTEFDEEIAAPVPDLASAAAAGPPPPAGGMAAMIAMAASERTDRVESGQARSIPDPTPPIAVEEEVEAPPAGGMAAMIAMAATKRTDRLEAGGEAKISGEAKPPPAPSMADMIASKAKDRTDRLDAGGEVQIRVIPEAHKALFVNIADEAAQIGQLTRLNEKFVEAIVPEKEVVEDTWIPTGLRTDNQRSKFFMVVNEAAALGQMRMTGKRKPKEVTNYEPTPEDDESSEEEDIDKLVDEHGRRVERTGLLMDQFVRENVRENRKKDWALDSTQDVQYKSIDDVNLPTARPPTYKPKNKKLSQAELMEAIGSGVAAAAWDRRFRLGRPNAGLKVTRKCDCRYCVNPNPYQTHAYKKILKDHKEDPEAKPLPQHPPKPTPYSKGKGEWKPPKKSTPPAAFQKPPDKVFQVPKPPPQIQPKAPATTKWPVPGAPGTHPAPPPRPVEVQPPKENIAPVPPDLSSSSDSDSSDSEAGKKKKKDGKKKKKSKKPKRKRTRTRKRSGKKKEPQETQVYVCSCTIL